MSTSLPVTEAESRPGALVSPAQGLAFLGATTLITEILWARKPHKLIRWLEPDHAFGPTNEERAEIIRIDWMCDEENIWVNDDGEMCSRPQNLESDIVKALEAAELRGSPGLQDAAKWALKVLLAQPDCIRTDTKERGDGELNELIPALAKALKGT